MGEKLYREIKDDLITAFSEQRRLSFEARTVIPEGEEVLVVINDYFFNKRKSGGGGYWVARYDVQHVQFDRRRRRFPGEFVNLDGVTRKIRGEEGPYSDLEKRNKDQEVRRWLSNKRQNLG